MPIDRKHQITLSGKTYVLYAGVLAEAHARGLSGIKTKLVQIPTEENGMVAIVRATVTMRSEGDDLAYTGYGDASPKNVNPRIATALLRMAETRAKGRALRDAIGCGETLAEEIDLQSEIAEHARKVEEIHAAIQADARPSRAPLPVKQTQNRPSRAPRPVKYEAPPGSRGPAFEETYVQGKNLFPRAGLIDGVIALLAEANAKGLPTGPEVTMETAREIPNAKLYAEGLALKKRLSAFDAMGGNVPPEEPLMRSAMEVGA